MILQGHPQPGKSQKCFVEVSLSKLLFGNNGRLIKTQSKIDMAMKRVHALVSQIADLPRLKLGTGMVPYSTIGFNRVDLCWQIRGRMPDFIRAHQYVRHPEVHKLPETYGEQTIRWKGSEMNILIYDKFEEIRDHNRSHKLPKSAKDVVRIEVQLTGSKLERLLGKGRTVRKLRIEVCYEALRQVLSPFRRTYNLQASRFLQACCLAISEHWKVGSQDAIDVLLAGYTPAGRAKMRRELHKQTLDAYLIDWQKELPPKMPSVLFVQHGCSFSMTSNYSATRWKASSKLMTSRHP